MTDHHHPKSPSFSAPETHDPSSHLQAVITEGEQDTAKYVYDNYGVHPETPIERPGIHPPRRRICGLSIPILILIITLVAIAIAAAVGGGVAGALSNRTCRRELTALKQESSTPTTGTSPAGASATPGNNAEIEGRIDVPKTKCPEANGTTYTTTVNSVSTTFVRMCNSVRPGFDLFQISTPSWSSCMDACAEYEEFFDALTSKGSTPACGGISYVPEWSIFPEYAMSNYSTRGSCWLKTNMDGLRQDGWHLAAEVVSAIKQE